MSRYSFVTHWEIRSPLPRVWEALFRAEEWPRWWRGVESVVELEPATGEHRVGSLRRFIWKSALPYRLTFDMRVTRVLPMERMESRALGELEGTGVWTFRLDGSVTRVRYDWEVRTTQPWMNWAAPLARPLFAWNHDVVMRWGGEGLKRLLEERPSGASAGREGRILPASRREEAGSPRR